MWIKMTRDDEMMNMHFAEMGMQRASHEQIKATDMG